MKNQNVHERALRAAAAVTGRRWLIRTTGALVLGAGLFASGPTEASDADPTSWEDGVDLASDGDTDDHGSTDGPWQPAQQGYAANSKGKGCFTWGPPAPPVMLGEVA